VRAAFRAAPGGADIDVTVVASAGAVTLRGMVASEDERSLADDVARQVDGVGSVDNELRVIRGTKVYPTPDSGGTR
jgi:osmotically-inducible protein OsmY